MKLSLDTRKEPTQTKRLQNDYALALRRLFRKYKTEVIDALEQSRLLEASGPHINVPWFANRLRDAGLMFVIVPGQKITDEYVRKSYQSGAVYAGMGLKRVGIQVSAGPNTPADWRAIDALKVRDLSALRGVTEETSKHIIEQLTTGIQYNEGIPQLAKRITDRVDSIGIARATTIARTEVINAFNQGAEVRYQQHGIQKVEWITAEDERVCSQCGPRDGQQFDMNSSFERAPLHPNCRCTYVPVIE